MEQLTVFTPTYNRAACLNRLYQSLLLQSCRDFIWLVVDDGSQDETPALLRKWSGEGKLALRWLRTENGGKHRAHNLGVRLAETELFFCVDSDDVLPGDAVEKLLCHWNACAEKQLAGIIAYKQRFSDRETGGRLYTRHPASLRSFYQNGLTGDAALVYRTKLLKEHPFPEIPGEKFMTENVVYAQIDREYPLLPLYRVLTITETRPDGYTHNALRLLRDNPKGWALYHRQCALFSDNRPQRRHHLRQFVCYAILSGEKQIFRICRKMNASASILPGYMLAFKRRLQYRTLRHQEKPIQDSAE
ncbi:glycosyltransferase family 2 protein [Candidatus Soleaferrea massiliensis]|uniref:glycosyltransferase family 2 protein n=1 Tax=Candidatus Soleaferrea massiliensis TaxID=1470354 RepID=UPI0006938EF6|nr:glycosyltransferase family 2 protein [Candidatus Soleaferrea massiliensis]